MSYEGVKECCYQIKKLSGDPGLRNVQWCKELLRSKTDAHSLRREFVYCIYLLLTCV